MNSLCMDSSISNLIIINDRPSTPINNVISNLYGLISEHELDLAYQQHLDKKNVMN